MDWLDIGIIVILALAVFFGLKAGIIKLLFMVVGIILGVVLAGRLSHALGSVFSFISDRQIADLIAFALIFLAVLAVAAVLAWVIKWAISAVMLGWVNRLGGAILGLFLGFLLCGAALAMWVKYLGISNAVDGSVLARFFLNGFPVVLGLLPSEFDSVRGFFK